MKRGIASTLAFVFLAVIIVPLLVVRGFDGLVSRSPQNQAKQKGEKIPIHVYVHETGKIEEMDLEEYVKGVVAAEMPAEFEVEAMKAQAVAARTYAVKNMVLFGGAGAASHPGADVSTDHHEGQAWASEAALKERWGAFNYDRYWRKVTDAVESTRGIIATYNGETINAVFHSSSGERTASALEVWGTDIPYLKSVPCPWDQKAPRYSESKEFTATEIVNRLGADAGTMAAMQNGGDVAQIIDRTESGRVDKVRIGDKVLSGLAVREKLDLRSANFSIETQADKMVFKTLGYGHGVGLSQYGANGMAKEGKNYRDILTYFYTGIALKNIYSN